MGEVIGMGVIVEGGHPITQGLLRRQDPVQERLDGLAPGLGVLVVEEAADVWDIRVRAVGQDADHLLGLRTNDAPISTKSCSNWPAASCAPAD
ncbi:hypothetical protein AB4225_38120 [Streptomyces sp. 2RAF24]|uniref:hypothetical protein n=1 Tax=unclassified Streptomyces TaxID=2593676 RepID=UPI0033E9CF3E